jgi:hypothetical protein
MARLALSWSKLASPAFTLAVGFRPVARGSPMTPEQAKSARLTLQIGHMQLSGPTLARLRRFYEAAGIDFTSTAKNAPDDSSTRGEPCVRRRAKLECRVGRGPVSGGCHLFSKTGVCESFLCAIRTKLASLAFGGYE